MKPNSRRIHRLSPETIDLFFEAVFRLTIQQCKWKWAASTFGLVHTRWRRIRSTSVYWDWIFIEYILRVNCNFTPLYVQVPPGPWWWSTRCNVIQLYTDILYSYLTHVSAKTSVFKSVTWLHVIRNYSGSYWLLSNLDLLLPRNKIVMEIIFQNDARWCFYIVIYRWSFKSESNNDVILVRK